MNVGFVGLGMMGRGMAGNILAAGHSLRIYDLSRSAGADLEAKGALWTETVRGLAEDCDIVFTSLPTPTDVERIGLAEDGLLAGLKSGSAWFDLSTSSVETSRRLYEIAIERGVAFMDAPVSGGPAGAATRKLAIWVGGPEEVFTHYLPVLEAMSDQVRRIGEIGAGTIAKLVHNMASTAICALLGEVMSIGVKAGLEPLPLWEAIRTGGAGRMRSFDIIASRFLQQKFDPPTFGLRLAHKDITLALELARENMVPTPLCDVVQHDIVTAMNRGWGGRDIQSFLMLQQERAHVVPLALTEAEVEASMARS